MNRQQRRASEKLQRKENLAQAKTLIPPPTTDVKSLEGKLNSVISDMQRVLNYAQGVETKYNLLVETLTLKKLCSWQDIANVEGLYRQREVNKKLKIKQLLQEDHTTREYLDLIKDDPQLPGFQRFGIEPVADLNINPYELAQIVRDDFPENTLEEQCAIGAKLYKLSRIHFGLE